MSSYDRERASVFHSWSAQNTITPFMVAGGGADSGQLQIGLRLMQPVGETIHGAIVAATDSAGIGAISSY